MTFAAFVLIPLLARSVLAQTEGGTDLEKLIRQQNAENVKGYIQPIADLFGANMNAGFIRNANIPKMGFNVRLDIIGMAAFVQSEQENYEAVDPWGRKFRTATVFGDEGQYSFNPLAPGDSTQAFRGSDGLFNTSIFPFAAPQLTIGHIYGTEAVIRYVPIPKIGSMPAITLFGIGVRHSVSQYIETIPVDLAAGFMYNRFTVGDLITVSGHAFTLQASKELSVLVLYGGIQLEKSTLKLTYTSTAGQNVDVELEGSNVVRGVIGAGLNLGFLKLFADANFGAVTSVSGGIGFGF
ncbi:MAG TPA: DUF6588 family protein [Bacteroidota bacterium]|nr:DUF6588 family protein [Bacteroidota bacterium]